MKKFDILDKFECLSVKGINWLWRKMKVWKEDMKESRNKRKIRRVKRNKGEGNKVMNDVEGLNNKKGNEEESLILEMNWMRKWLM